MAWVTILISVFCASAVLVGVLKVPKDSPAYKLLEDFGDGAGNLLKITLTTITVVNAVWLGLWLVGLLRKT